MIEQVLQRDAVLQQLQRIKNELSVASDTRRRVTAPLPTVVIDGEALTVTEDDLREAADELAKAEARESASSSGQPGFEPAADRRGQTAKPLDDVVFISREPAIGLLQSALEQYHLGEKPETVAESPRRGMGQSEPVSDRRLLNGFSETDPGWIASVVAMGIRLFKKPHRFSTNPANVRIGNQARMLVVGDWGTGIKRAQGIADMMREVLKEGRREGRDQHVVHLGDTYYSGWGWECESRFLKHWPVDSEDADFVSSWNLNGNHDMFSGGYGYFDTLLGDGRFQRQQGTSYFRLYNDDWQLLGLDTAYKDNALFGPQSEWIGRQVTDSQLKTMLLSHHQPFSAYEKGGIEMDKTLRGFLALDRIRSWLFGHEHRCVLYGEHMAIKYPRLIGHGGVPVYMGHSENDPFEPPVTYEYRKYISHGVLIPEHWALFGFAVLDFDGPRIAARYFYEDGFVYPDKAQQPPDTLM